MWMILVQSKNAHVICLNSGKESMYSILSVERSTGSLPRLGFRKWRHYNCMLSCFIDYICRVLISGYGRAGNYSVSIMPGTRLNNQASVLLLSCFYSLVFIYYCYILCFFAVFNPFSGCFRPFRTNAVNWSPNKVFLKLLLDSFLLSLC